jgi:plastocyanin
MASRCSVCKPHKSVDGSEVLKSVRAVALLLIFVPSGGVRFAWAHDFTVSGQVRTFDENGSSVRKDSSNVVIWLQAVNAKNGVRERVASVKPKHHFELIQENKEFHPHVLVVPVGAVVEFPNRDLLFHSAFSMFDNTRFDLGLYEAGSAKSVTFSKPGVSYIFCNIHAQMSATVITLETPYFAVSNHDGHFSISGVPAGAYAMSLWAEGASAESLKAMEMIIVVDQDLSGLGTFDLRLSTGQVAHKNKYDASYDRSTETSSYDQ